MRGWCLEVWGDYACFTRPEMKVERVSYDIMTPSAARGIFEAILWKPGIKWNITSIEVLNPIKWISVRRNEVGKVIPKPSRGHISGDNKAPLGMYIEDVRQQRAGLFLKDVRYRIYGYFDFIPPGKRQNTELISAGSYADNRDTKQGAKGDETEAKYAAMFGRRARMGQCFHRPYLGCREFACDFRLIDSGDKREKPINETRDLGFMLYDMDFSDVDNPQPEFFRAYMEKGVVNTDRSEVEVIQ
ncbi:MAG: type I-C CRISPR-associated protein Cas5 [Clostridiales bacterium]|nr:type I-C CRISPR-associated protein Cas5 [Clostridiales bacterium]